MTAFIIIAALNQDRVIGINNAIPWRIRSDMQRFQRLTMGHPIIMGRSTWDSLPHDRRPLLGRTNIVLTRNAGHAAVIRTAGASAAASLEEARRLVAGDTEAFIIGGGDVYQQAIAFADRMELTHVLMHTPGSGWLTRFPEWDPQEWSRSGIMGRLMKQGMTDSHFSAYETLVRATALAE